MQENTYTVSEINNYIKSLLDKAEKLRNVQVIGEISNFKCYSSGHCYFSLKDKSGVLKCVMFSYRARNLQFKPQNGDTVIAVGHIAVYERDGVYQLYVDVMLQQGQGDLMVAYEQLKNKLEKEGLFAADKKQVLPVNPKTIGIVTSPSGAAVHDIITVSRRRNPGIKLILYPVRVQGTEASGEIVKAIEFFNRQKLVDVLIVGRGGGSIEDLWAFNEEATVRAVAASKLPIVSAVGHETDFTLCDFAADKRAATPSQAAEIAVADVASYYQQVVSLQKRAQSLLENRVQHLEHLTKTLCNSLALKEPERLFVNKEQRLDMASQRLLQGLTTKLQQANQSFLVQTAKLESLSPLAILNRGYSVTSKNTGELVKSVDDIEVNSLFSEIVTQVADGKIYSSVTHIERQVP